MTVYSITGNALSAIIVPQSYLKERDIKTSICSLDESIKGINFRRYQMQTMTLVTATGVVNSEVNLSKYCKGWADFFQLDVPAQEHPDYLLGWQQANERTRMHCNISVETRS